MLLVGVKKMKKNIILILLSLSVLNCISVDVTPSYHGDYKFSYTITTIKDGVEKKSSIIAGIVNVSAGTSAKTIQINNYKDKDGNLIDFRIKFEKFNFNEKYTKQGCELDNTYSGTIDQNLITLKQTLNVKCGSSFESGIIEGKGIK